MECVLCGKEAVTRAEVDGVILDVCAECTKYGKEIRKVVIIEPKRKEIVIPEMDYVLKEDFVKIVKDYRMKKGLTQEQLSALLKEKASIVKKIEEGWMPPLSIVSKLERLIGTNLLETVPDAQTKRKDNTSVTLGDLVNMK